MAIPKLSTINSQLSTDKGPLEIKSFAFAVRVVKLHRFLCSGKKEFVLSKQLLRCGTAISAMVREAEQAESKPDFIHKMAIALKEANETEYWILLLRETEYLNAVEADSIITDNKELLKLLTSIIKSTKRGMTK
jgi:four helix bundle protein